MTNAAPSAPHPVPTPSPVETPKPGVFLPWLLVGLVLALSLGVHVVMDPVSEAMERLMEKIGILQGIVTEFFPASSHGIIRELLSWVSVTSVQTPYGSVAGFIFTGVVMLAVVRPFLASFLGAFVGHPLLFLTGGTDQGWRYTWRAFAFNRIAVELASVTCFVAVAYSPLKPAWQILILLFVVPGIRLIGMGALLAQIVRGQGIGFFRTFFLVGPVFALFTIASMLLSIASVLWVGLW
ncbi:MAG: hypothetical protein RI910_2369, partial [Verrucomicrobiota bacterium]